MKSIFIIDDDMLVSRIYRDMFMNEGYSVETAGDGEEALAPP